MKVIASLVVLSVVVVVLKAQEPATPQMARPAGHRPATERFYVVPTERTYPVAAQATGYKIDPQESNPFQPSKAKKPLDPEQLPTDPKGTQPPATTPPGQQPLPPGLQPGHPGGQPPMVPPGQAPPMATPFAAPSAAPLGAPGFMVMPRSGCGGTFMAAPMTFSSGCTGTLMAAPMTFAAPRSSCQGTLMAAPASCFGSTMTFSAPVVTYSAPVVQTFAAPVYEVREAAPRKSKVRSRTVIKERSGGLFSGGLFGRRSGCSSSYSSSCY